MYFIKSKYLSIVLQLSGALVEHFLGRNYSVKAFRTFTHLGLNGAISTKKCFIKTPAKGINSFYV